MMFKFYAFLFCSCVGIATAAAQVQPFWTEQFTGGFPTGWTTADQASNAKKCLWTWCSNPEKGDDEAGCPEIWNTITNQQKPFAASTASTGFLVMDSDDYEELPSPHLSLLTSAPIDCSGKNEVWLQFQTHIGVYDYNADVNALLQVSTDLNNWTDFTVFPGLTTTIRW